MGECRLPTAKADARLEPKLRRVREDDCLLITEQWWLTQKLGGWAGGAGKTTKTAAGEPTTALWIAQSTLITAYLAGNGFK
jgi:hypothetical protein